MRAAPAGFWGRHGLVLHHRIFHDRERGGCRVRFNVHRHTASSLSLGPEASVALLSASGLVLCFLVIATQYKKVRKHEFLVIIACIVPIMPLGYLLYAKLRPYEGVLKLIMGVVIAYVSVRAIYWRMIRKQENKTSRFGMYLALGVGAIVQGMFSTGGALINVYTASRIRDKSEFRATLVAVWITTNVISLIYRTLVLHMLPGRSA
jgi:heme/copper-type cytochrome/quinol oxidase subunit 4